MVDVMVRQDCADCDEALPPRRRLERPPEFCGSCLSAQAKVIEGGTEAAREAHGELRAAMPKEAGVWLAYCAPALVRPDGVLVVAARADVRRWMFRRFRDIDRYRPAGVAFVGSRAAAAELAARRL